MKHSWNLKIVLVVLTGTLLMPLLAGCIFAPTIDSIQRSGLTEASRMRLLTVAVKDFCEGLQWGDDAVVLGLVTQRAQPVVREQLKSKSKDERTVESRVEEVVFSENAYKAEVEVTLRYYLAPFYIVRDRLEKQEWVYSLTDGWKLDKRLVMDQSS